MKTYLEKPVTIVVDFDLGEAKILRDNLTYNMRIARKKGVEGDNRYIVKVVVEVPAR